MLMFSILKNYMNFIMIYHFYQKKRILETRKKLVANLYHKSGCYTHKKLKQVLNHGLVLKKVHRVIKFNENARLKKYTDMKT